MDSYLISDGISETYIQGFERRRLFECLHQVVCLLLPEKADTYTLQRLTLGDPEFPSGKILS
jgi:hypothetical protein